MSERVEKAMRDDWEAHWRKYADAAARSPAQEYRRRLVLDALARTPIHRVIDIGAGTGDLVANIRTSFPKAEILGVDVSGSGLAVARERVPDATFLQRDLLENQRGKDTHRGWATHAICSEVLEHVADPTQFLRNANAYLAPGCVLVVTVPGGPMSAFDRHIGHRRHFSPADLSRVLTDAGFEVKRAWRAGFPFFNLYRVAVILRGERLVEEGAAQSDSRLVRAFEHAFRILFRLNLPRSRWGWQTMAVARLPD